MRYSHAQQRLQTGQSWQCHRSHHRRQRVALVRAARGPAVAGLLAAPLAAKARLTIPPSVLARADEIIE